MTRIDKSIEQNIAEAAAPLEERDLTQAIADHRLLYRSEAWIPRLHVRTGNGSTTAAWKDSADADPADRPVSGAIGWTGMAFNPQFENYINEDYGRTFPWSKALLFLRWNVCRRTHTEHWERPEWRGSLCYELVSFVIRRETSLDYARLQLGLPEEGKTRRTLDSALLTIERRLEVLLADDKARQSLPARSPAEWMSPVHRARHDQPGLHQEDCPACIRHDAA